jgi:prolyl-tRNA synthetase
MQRRDEDPFEKHFMEKEEFIRDCTDTLEEIQSEILRRAIELRDSNISDCLDLTEFDKHWTDNDQPGWLTTPWAGSNEEEEALSKKHKISIRCFPNDQQDSNEAPCLVTGKPTQSRAIWARSY